MNSDLGDHAVDLGLAEAALIVVDGDVVLAGRRFVAGGHVQDAIGVQLVGDLDLRGATRRRGDAVQVELTQQVVVLGFVALTCE